MKIEFRMIIVMVIAFSLLHLGYKYVIFSLSNSYQEHSYFARPVMLVVFKFFQISLYTENFSLFSPDRVLINRHLKNLTQFFGNQVCLINEA